MKKIGGSPRSIIYNSINQMGNIAIVEVKLESQFRIFNSVIVSVCANNQWKVISNILTIVEK